MKGITTSTKPRDHAEGQAQDAVDGADPAVEHGVGDARRDQMNDDQDDQEDDAADGHLGDVDVARLHRVGELLGHLLGMSR